MLMFLILNSMLYMAIIILIISPPWDENCIMLVYIFSFICDAVGRQRNQKQVGQVNHHIAW